MVGLKVSEGAQAVMTPSPKKKDKKLKLKGSDSVTKAPKPLSPADGGAAKKKKPITPVKSTDNDSPKKKKGKGFGKFGSRNAMKAKDDVFTKMVKEKAAKEHLSPVFMKRLDKCVARLPPGGKRFVYWLVHDVQYKIKFLPIIEEVFKLIKESDVLPLPSNGQAPKSKAEKKKARQLKRKQQREAAGIVLPPKGSGKKTGDGDTTKQKKRKIDEVGEADGPVSSPMSAKKKKNKAGNLSINEKSVVEAESADSSFNAGESNSVSKKKKKRNSEKISN